MVRIVPFTWLTVPRSAWKFAPGVPEEMFLEPLVGAAQGPLLPLLVLMTGAPFESEELPGPPFIMTDVPFIAGGPPDPGPALVNFSTPPPVVTLTAVYVLPVLITTTLTGVPSFKALAAILASWVNVVALEYVTVVLFPCVSVSTSVFALMLLSVPMVALRAFTGGATFAHAVAVADAADEAPVLDPQAANSTRHNIRKIVLSEIALPI
jgi:hypothetical protein